MLRCDHRKLALTLSIRTHCITFNAVITLLAVSSATDTVHIFKFKGGNGEGERKRASGLSSPGGSVDSQETGKAEREWKEDTKPIWTGRRRTVSGPRSESIRHVGILTRLCFAQASDVGYEVYRGAERQYGKHDGRLSFEGFFYSYTIDLDNGGECVLNRQY
ncbi:unnamed protein product, partial [Rhizoctonia solani]